MSNSAHPHRRSALSPLAQLRGAFERTNKAAGIALAILVCLFWAQFLRPQSLGGHAAYVLVSGQSMEPRYHTGDLVLVEQAARATTSGQLIAYRVPKGDPMAGAQVIHRIIGGDAKHGFIVQGDNRTAPDVWRPKPADIVGAKALRIPNAILILQFLRDPIFLALLAACFVFVRVLHAPATSKPEATGCGMTRRVLIAESDEDVRELLELTVRRLGYETVARRTSAATSMRCSSSRRAPRDARRCGASARTRRRSSASASIRAKKGSSRRQASPTS